MQPGWQGSGFPQQGGWQGYPPFGHELHEPEDTAPQHREGYERMSNRIFVTPAEASSADVVSELSDAHGLVVQEKSFTSLRPEDWPDEATFSAEINKVFKVKAGKPGTKFWKGVREAVMKQCTTHDLVLVFQSPGMEAEEAAELHLEQVSSLIKNVLEAADTKAAADSIVGLKSGSVLAVLVGWTSDEVGTWPVVNDDPIPSSNSLQQQWARRNYPDDSQDYSQGHPAQSLRQVPPRQRLGFQRPPPWQQGQPQPYPQQQHAYRQGGYGNMQPMVPHQQQYGYPQGPPQMMQGYPQHQQHGMQQQQFMGNSSYGGQGPGIGPGGGAGHPSAGGGGYGCNGGYGNDQPGFQGQQQGGPQQQMSMRAAAERAAAEALWNGGATPDGPYDPSGMNTGAAVFIPGGPQQNGPPAGMQQGGPHRGMPPQGGMQRQGGVPLRGGMTHQPMGHMSGHMEPASAMDGNGVMNEQVAAPSRLSMEDAALRAAAESLWGQTGGASGRSPAAAPAATPPSLAAAAPFMIPSNQPGLASLELNSMQAAAGQLWSGMAPAAALPESSADDLHSPPPACLDACVASAMGLDGGSVGVGMGAAPLPAGAMPPAVPQTVDGTNELLANLRLGGEAQRLPGFGASLHAALPSALGLPPSLPPSAPTSRPPSREEEALAALERHEAFDFDDDAEEEAFAAAEAAAESALGLPPPPPRVPTQKATRLPGNSTWGKAAAVAKAHGIMAEVEPLCLLGRGAFGKVMLVRGLHDGAAYAMKVLRVDAIAKQRMAAEVQTERDVMVSFARQPHPFVVPLLRGYRSGSHYHVVMPLLPGGTLFAHIKALDPAQLPEVSTRFYGAQIALALGELHARGVLYLDLKLENVLISAAGDAVLVDFGLAQQGVDVAAGATAKRVGGTRAYLSPEAISSNHVGAAADWWALGVVLFEMLTGGAPFVGADKKALQASICNCRMRFPAESTVSGEARSLVRRLLAKQPEQRLGVAAGVAEVQSHPFFRGLDWAALLACELQPPHVPVLEHDADVRHFEAKYTAQPARITDIEPSGRPAHAAETLHSGAFDFTSATWPSHPGSRGVVGAV